MRIFFLTIAAVFSSNVSAMEESMNNPDFALGSVLASLLLVIACIFLFAFLMKKTNLLKNGQGKTAMKVVATLPLTNKGRVQIVELNGQHYLLGVTEQNISLLDKYSKPLTTDEPTTKEVNTSFATLLAKISRKSDA